MASRRGDCGEKCERRGRISLQVRWLRQVCKKNAELILHEKLMLRTDAERVLFTCLSVRIKFVVAVEGGKGGVARGRGVLGRRRSPQNAGILCLPQTWRDSFMIAGWGAPKVRRPLTRVIDLIGIRSEENVPRRE